MDLNEMLSQHEKWKDCLKNTIVISLIIKQFIN